MQYDELVNYLIEKNLTISTMESCTSGLVASTITNTAGASSILKGAFVTYSNEAKIMQGVPKESIKEFGVYSPEVALDMALACSCAYKSIIGIGVTGVLGNIDKNNKDGVVGVVYYAIRFNSFSCAYKIIIPDEITNRCEMKEYVVKEILDKLFGILKGFLV